jgi:peptide/nickel transport system substrate-binding protein
MSRLAPLRIPLVALAAALLALVLVVACGGTEQPAAQTQATAMPAATDAPAAPAAAAATEVPSGGESAPTRPSFVASTPVTDATPTPEAVAREGELKTNDLIFLFSQQTRQGIMDCDVTGSATSQHRASHEFMLDPNRYTGALDPQLATDWSVSEDGRTWNFKLREGVEFHFGYGEFTAHDVVNSLNYYTNPACAASYSDYFRTNPRAEPEIISDHEINIRMGVRPELIFDYWISGYRGLPMTSKAQWDTGCPNGAADYESFETSAHLDGYCTAGEATLLEQGPARLGPYQFNSFEKGIGWLWERSPIDHYRIDPDWDSIEILIVEEASTRLASMVAREAQLATIDRALVGAALDSGLDLAESQVTAVNSMMVFGGMYHSTKEGEAFEPYSAASYDPSVPWAAQGESGTKVRMAMNKAIDRDAIRENLFDGQGDEGRVAGLIPSAEAFGGEYAGYNPEWESSWEELYGYDVDRAKELLIEAGYPNGFHVPIISYTMSGLPEMKDYVVAIAAMWEKIGLETEIREMEFSAWRQEYRGATTTCCVYPFRGYAEPPHPTIHFAYSPERFMRFYVSDTAWENTYQALNSLSFEEQLGHWHAVTDELFYNVVSIPLHTLSVQVVIDPEVVEEYAYLGPYGGQFTDLEHIRGVRY